MTERETIAVLGAGGTMGLAMARNLVRAGFGVRAYNRSPREGRAARRGRRHAVQDARRGLGGATVVLTMLSDADAVLDVMDGPDGALAGEPRRTSYGCR